MSTPRRLLCVYQHAPTPGAPGIYRHRLLLSELVKRGWEVDLVSTPVNYMTGEIPAPYRRRPYVRQTIDGIVHHWVYAPSGIHVSKRRRAMNYAAFATGAALRGATLSRPDAILVSSPPLSVGAIGPMLAAWFRRPWLLEVRDLWPESAASVGWLSEDSVSYRALAAIARKLTSDARAVLVPTSGLVSLVVRHGAHVVRVVPGAVVPSPQTDNARRVARARLGIRDATCVFVYSGAVGAANGLGILVDALALLQRNVDALVLVVGDGSARADLDDRARQLGLDQLRMIGAVPRGEVASFLAAADVGLHVLRPDPLFASALPTKVLDYFSSGLPFITTVPGLPERLAQASGGGFAPDAEKLAVELERWVAMSEEQRRQRGVQSAAFGIERFGLGSAVDRLESLLIDVTTRGYSGTVLPASEPIATVIARR